jgi:tetratricopeptide (TPR) repeat protein
MASPSNASEPESPESPEDDEEIIAAGFDPLLFWDQYRQTILLVGGVVLLGLVGFGVYEYNLTQNLAAAGAALAQASSEDDYRAVMSKYAGTTAAGNAAILLSGALRQDRKYDEALDTLRTFVDKYPTHPMVDAGDLAIGETLEEQGKTQDAMAQYQEVAAKYPESFSAPIAVIDQANLLVSQGKPDEAKRIYQNFVAQFPNSELTREAMGEMHLLRSPAGGDKAAAGSETESNGLTKLLSPAPASSAAPSAASAPVMPVMPGVSPH